MTREMDIKRDNAGVIAFPPLIWLVGAIVSALVRFFLVHLPITANYGVCLACGILFIVLAPTIALSALVTMLRAGTNVDPGKPALTVVRGGPFRFTRNPMYLALCFVQIALGFFWNDWITLAVVIPLFLILHFGVVLREEHYLEAKFGEEYLAFKRSVRRWI